MRAVDKQLLFCSTAQRRTRQCQWVLLLTAASSILPVAHAADSEITDQYRLTIELNARFNTNFAGSGTLGFFANPDLENQTYRLEWPNITYLPTHWLHVSGGLRTEYTDNHKSPNELELRPFFGAKLFVPNKAKLTIFNYTRYEYRNTENLATHDWDRVSRLRSLFEIDVPLTSRERAWKPKTWFALVGAEPFYEFDMHDIEQLRLSAGLGYVMTDRLRVEFTYYSQFTRPNGGGLAYTENIFLLNFRFSLHEGLLGALFNPSGDNGKDGSK
jgi:Protein of unknown function (DUF2490)